MDLHPSDLGHTTPERRNVWVAGSSWQDVPGQVRTPRTAAPNYNQDDFPPVTAQLVRVMVTRAPSRAVGIKEVQLFDTPS